MLQERAYGQRVAGPEEEAAMIYCIGLAIGRGFTAIPDQEFPGVAAFRRDMAGKDVQENMAERI